MIQRNWVSLTKISNDMERISKIEKWGKTNKDSGKTKQWTVTQLNKYRQQVLRKILGLFKAKKIKRLTKINKYSQQSVKFLQRKEQKRKVNKD